MKRFITIAFAFMLVLSVALAGCGKNEKNEKSAKSESEKKKEKLSVVCTTFPTYDWVRQILGDKVNDVDLTLLQKDKIDLHSYEPSVEDIAKISSSDLFIYVGGESDEWVEDALKEAKNKDMATINLVEAIGTDAKTEEVVEGMEPEEEEGEEEGEAYDEHVWLSLKNAEKLCSVITDELVSLDNGNSEVYQNNLSAYMKELTALDSQYQAAIQAAPVKTFLMGDRFPFRYMADDYGLDYYAAFVGCSAETEASFETIAFLAKKTDELALKNIVVTESSDQSIAKTIRDNTANKNQQILVMDSLQSIGQSDLDQSTTYVSAMQKNLDTLKSVLQ